MRERPERSERVDVAIIGGGLAGIAAAARLKERGVQAIVLEGAAELGGKARAVDAPASGADVPVLSRGPIVWEARRQSITRLMSMLGLTDDVMATLPARARYVVRGGRLCALEPSALSMITSKALGNVDRLRLLAESLLPRARRPAEEDESLASFFRRRFGHNIAEGLMFAMANGIWAGDPEHLSASSCFPDMVAAERDHGSVIVGTVRRLRAARGAQPKGSLTLRGGLGSVGPAARAVLDARPRTLVSSLEQRADNVVVRARGADGREVVIEARGVVLAVEAPAARALLADTLGTASAGSDPSADSIFAQVSYAPITLVHWRERQPGTARLPAGFGYLSPPRERSFALGALFASDMLPSLAGTGPRVFSSFVGGVLAAERARFTDDELARGLGDELVHLTGGELGEVLHVERVAHAVSQPTLGHARRMESLRTLLSTGRVALAGSWLGAGAMKDAVESGFAAADDIAERLSRALVPAVVSAEGRAVPAVVESGDRDAANARAHAIAAVEGRAVPAVVESRDRDADIARAPAIAVTGHARAVPAVVESRDRDDDITRAHTLAVPAVVESGDRDAANARAPAIAAVEGRAVPAVVESRDRDAANARAHATAVPAAVDSRDRDAANARAHAIAVPAVVESRDRDADIARAHTVAVPAVVESRDRDADNARAHDIAEVTSLREAVREPGRESADRKVGTAPLAVVGASYRDVATEVRARLAAAEHGAEAPSRALVEAGYADGVVFLETCSRVEWIISSSRPAWAAEILKSTLAKRVPESRVHTKTGHAGAHYLLRVAMGLDSVAEGEPAVGRQLVLAFQAAHNNGDADRALRLAWRGVQQLIGERRRRGVVRHGLGVQTLVLEELNNKGVGTKETVLVFGQGEIGRAVLAALKDAGYNKAAPHRRTTQLQFLAEAERARAVIVCTGGPAAFVALPMREDAALVIDIGVPMQVKSATGWTQVVLEDLLMQPRCLLDDETRSWLVEQVHLSADRLSKDLADPVPATALNAIDEERRVFLRETLPPLLEKLPPSGAEEVRRACAAFAHHLMERVRAANTGAPSSIAPPSGHDETDLHEEVRGEVSTGEGGEGPMGGRGAA